MKTSEELGVSNIEPICDSSSETEAEDNNALKLNDEDSPISPPTNLSKKLVNPDQLDNNDANLLSSSQCSSPSIVNKKSLVTSKNSELYRRVNLDVSCLIAYVSSTSNGGCHFAYGDKFVNEQAMLERKSPVKDVLNAYFKGIHLLYDDLTYLPLYSYYKLFLTYFSSCTSYNHRFLIVCSNFM